MEEVVRKISETPDHWVILKITPEEGNPFYRVYGGWMGGYLDGDRWKLNSGVTKVEDDENYYYFYGYSGSCYKCHKKGYGITEDNVSRFTSYCTGVLGGYTKEEGVEIMDNNTNWLEINY